MTTALAIEAMTDAGQFEILATRVLRKVDADYARVEHLGVNADGKTVKNPVYGFTMVPGTKPSRFVMAEAAVRPHSVDRQVLQAIRRWRPCQASRLAAAWRVTFWGALAMALTAGVGALFGAAV